MKAMLIAFSVLFFSSAHAYELIDRETSAVSWLMGSKNIQSFEELIQVFKREFYSYGIDREGQSADIWFRYRSTNEVCDIEIKPSGLIRTARCVPFAN